MPPQLQCPGASGFLAAEKHKLDLAEITTSLELTVVAAQQAGSPLPARESARRLNVTESTKAGHGTSEHSALPYAAKLVGSIRGSGLPLRVPGDQIEDTAARSSSAPPRSTTTVPSCRCQRPARSRAARSTRSSAASSQAPDRSPGATRADARALLTSTLRFAKETLQGCVPDLHFELCVFVDAEQRLLFRYFDAKHHSTARSMGERERSPTYTPTAVTR